GDLAGEGAGQRGRLSGGDEGDGEGGGREPAAQQALEQPVRLLDLGDLHAARPEGGGGDDEDGGVDEEGAVQRDGGVQEVVAAGIARPLLRGARGGGAGPGAGG